jgi:hypothetical protein
VHIVVVPAGVAVLRLQSYAYGYMRHPNCA